MTRFLHLAKASSTLVVIAVDCRFCIEGDSERSGPRGGEAKSTGQLWDNYGTIMEQLYGTTMEQPISNGICVKSDNLKVKNVVLLEKDTCS